MIDIAPLPVVTSIDVPDPTYCPGSEAEITAIFADGGQYTVTYRYQGATYVEMTQGVVDRLVLPVPVGNDPGPSTVEIVSVTEGGGCATEPDAVFPTATIIVGQPPRVTSIIDIACNTDDNQTYSVSFNWENLGSPPLTIRAEGNPVPAQNFLDETGTYISVPQIANETETRFILENADGCTFTTPLVSGEIGGCGACSNLINSGDPQEVRFCEGDELSFDRIALFTPEGEENLVYIIHDEQTITPNSAVDTLFGLSLSDAEVEIDLDDSLNYNLNTTYFVTALIGNTDNDNTVPSQEQDGCTQQSIIAEFIIYSLPEVSFASIEPVCFDADEQDIEINITGLSDESAFIVTWFEDEMEQAPVDFETSGSGVLTSLTPSAEVDSAGVINFRIFSIFEDSTGCTMIYPDSILTDSLVINPLPILLIEDATFSSNVWQLGICRGSELILTTTPGLASYDWSVDGEPGGNSNVFIRDEIDESITVNLTAMDDNMCRNETSVIVEALNIPEPSIEDDLPIICLGATGVRFDIFDNANLSSLGTVTWSGFESWGTTDNPNGRDYAQGPLARNQISLDLLPGLGTGTYTIFGTVESGSSVNCSGVDSLTFMVSNQQAPPFLEIQYLPAGNILIYPDASFDCYQWGVSTYDENGLEIEEFLENGNAQAFAGGDDFLDLCETRDYWVEVTNADCGSEGACTT